MGTNATWLDQWHRISLLLRKYLNNFSFLPSFPFPANQKMILVTFYEPISIESLREFWEIIEASKQRHKPRVIHIFFTIFANHSIDAQTGGLKKILAPLLQFYSFSLPRKSVWPKASPIWTVEERQGETFQVPKRRKESVRRVRRLRHLRKPAIREIDLARVTVNKELK